MNVLVQHTPRIIPVKPRRRTCAKAVSFPRFAEAVNGRASMYGVVFGGSNWALTGLNISEQMHQRPFCALALLSSALVMASVSNAVDKLDDTQFEDWATLETGRTFMILFALMVVVPQLN